MNRFWYRSDIPNFLNSTDNEVLGALTNAAGGDIVSEQRDAWVEQVNVLRTVLAGRSGAIYFEYSIPRMGRRIDAVLLLRNVIFVVEFKVGEDRFLPDAMDQVFDYALDLKNFHETSLAPLVAPLLVATEGVDCNDQPQLTPHGDNLLYPCRTNSKGLMAALDRVLAMATGPNVDPLTWESGGYRPTPTIIEAAMALYGGHSVQEISRSDAGAENLARTASTIDTIIERSKRVAQKAIVFVTGVPGAGKTLVGLNAATKHFDIQSDSYSVFLSGNGPLVDILREALTRDRVRLAKEKGQRKTKREVLSQVKVFVQNVHNFRDDLLVDKDRPPIEHVTLFDEAQRAWTLEQTRSFMKRKKGVANFPMSEPEFLISCLDRHKDWAVIVCLVGGGQEINTGEAGIGEWIESLQRSFDGWKVYVSSRLTDAEYGTGRYITQLKERGGVTIDDGLHLSVSMRSFRAENVSALVKEILDLEEERAREILGKVSREYPIVLTRDVQKARQWLRSKARGSERYGLVVSSQAERLRPQGIFVKSPMEPVHWFLDGKEDTRSSYYLEDVATEFSIQGLELDWVGVIWDADFRYAKDGWVHRSFVGERWNKIGKPQRQVYQKNAYRVLLTRARQGMVIVVPQGERSDPTRMPEFYDPTFRYLKKIGLTVI